MIYKSLQCQCTAEIFYYRIFFKSFHLTQNVLRLLRPVTIFTKELDIMGSTYFQKCQPFHFCKLTYFVLNQNGSEYPQTKVGDILDLVSSRCRCRNNFLVYAITQKIFFRFKPNLAQLLSCR